MPQLIVTINDQSMLPNLRRVIKSLHGVDKVAVPRETKDTRKLNPTQRKQLVRLEKLEKLKPGWDDEDAFPIEAEVLATFRKMIAADKAQILRDWIIFPATNGTLQLKAKKRQAVISVGNKDYSFVYHQDDHDEYGNHEELSISALTELIKHINE